MASQNLSKDKKIMLTKLMVIYSIMTLYMSKEFYTFKVNEVEEGNECSKYHHISNVFHLIFAGIGHFVPFMLIYLISIVQPNMNKFIVSMKVFCFLLVTICGWVS